MSTTKRPALGRGLSALLENADTDITSRKTSDLNVAGSVSNILLSQIETNPFQPRTEFEKKALVDLANSIREQGIIQPVTVRKLGYDKYQIISGERRFRASQMAGLTQIPVYIRIANDQAMLEMALVENIQRENLNAIDIAISYARLIDECSLTQEELSKRVGKERSTVSNFIRLLKLPAEIQKALRENKITMGHARALLSLETDEKRVRLFHDILKNELSVRRVEELTQSKKSKKRISKGALSFEQQKFVVTMKEMFLANVELTKDIKGKGRIIIPFDSENELNRIIEILEH